MPLPVWRRGERAGLITPRSQDRNLSPVFYNSVVLQKQLVKLTTLNELAFTGVAQRLARRAHNPEVVCSNHTAGILQFGGFPEATSLLLQTLNTGSLYRDGAAAARRTHNPEVTRSRRVAGILHFGCFAEPTCQARDIK